jgi:hypothetical protein
MTDDPTAKDRAAQSRALVILMWAYLFFLPVPVSRWTPDIAGWVMMFLAFRMLCAAHERLRPLLPLVAVGVGLWACNAFLPAARESERLARWLMIARWGLLAGVSWWFCRVIMRFARDSGAHALAQSASWKRWACPTAFVLLAALPLVPPRLEVYYGWAFLVAAIVAITAMMSLAVAVGRLVSIPAVPAAEPAEAEAGDE